MVATAWDVQTEGPLELGDDVWLTNPQAQKKSKQSSDLESTERYRE